MRSVLCHFRGFFWGIASSGTKSIFVLLPHFEQNFSQTHCRILSSRAVKSALNFSRASFRAKLNFSNSWPFDWKKFNMFVKITICVSGGSFEEKHFFQLKLNIHKFFPDFGLKGIKNLVRVVPAGILSRRSDFYVFRGTFPWKIWFWKKWCFSLIYQKWSWS